MLKEIVLMFFGFILCSSGLKNQKPDFNIILHFHDAEYAENNGAKDKNEMDYSNDYKTPLYKLRQRNPYGG